MIKIGEFVTRKHRRLTWEVPSDEIEEQHFDNCGKFQIVIHEILAANLSPNHNMGVFAS